MSVNDPNVAMLELVADYLGDALRAELVFGPNQIDQGLPRHNCLNLGEKLLSIGALLGRGQLIVRETELLAAH